MLSFPFFNDEQQVVTDGTVISIEVKPVRGECWQRRRPPLPKSALVELGNKDFSLARPYRVNAYNLFGLHLFNYYWVPNLKSLPPSIQRLIGRCATVSAPIIPRSHTPMLNTPFHLTSIQKTWPGSIEFKRSQTISPRIRIKHVIMQRAAFCSIAA
ncbi:hypothetical protein AVEN_2132-1 [Araneus ventricosus]|uniref:Uncharacterized protein n=1 Tax=Araneus ventricosus TaxID=182803 RepID=A0A4Y2E9L7_ARAVE|nr:hypothetical protein AVEN_2132-1 [Araneus ventricosus]